MPKKTDTEAQPLEGNDACISMHTALRKVADSAITTAAYNLIHLLCEIHFHPSNLDPWRMYGRFVAERVNKGEKPEQACKAASSQLREVFMEEFCKIRDAEHKSRLDENCKTAMYALSGVLRCFDNQDWLNMAAYLGPSDED